MKEFPEVRVMTALPLPDENNGKAIDMMRFLLMISASLYFDPENPDPSGLIGSGNEYLPASA